MEIRKLNKDEFVQLLNEAPESETEGIRNYLVKYKVNPYEYFENEAIESDALLNGRPLYFGALTFDVDDNRFLLWTITNTNIQAQKTLYKESKKRAVAWANKYGEIYAIMYKGIDKNIRWAQKMGFKIIEEKDNMIVLCLKGEQI